MGIGPGNIAYGMPPAPDDVVRRQRDLERQARENAAARTGQAMQIGSGGILVTDGGSITIDGGDLNVGSGALNSAGSVSAGTTISAGTDITAGGKVTAAGEVKGGTVTSTGNVAASGAVSGASVAATGPVSGATGTFPNGITAVSVHNNLLTHDYVSVYVDDTGRFGYQPSASRFKQDVTPAVVDPEPFYNAEVVHFRYKQAVEQRGESAAIEIGGIAEQFEACGLGEYVTRNSDGTLTGIAYERLSIGLIGVVQSLNARLNAAGIA